MPETKATEITVFTGFLGAGKTTIILDLIKRLSISNPEHKLAILKNEFGDTKVDSLLAKENSIQVTEMLNGCLCCVLVGQMKNALEEIRATYAPDRIIVESSGSAFPAPIAWQVRQLEPYFHLDSIITVIDCVNFRGYEDTSYTAKLQAGYTNVILLNKWDLVTERELDIVLDHVYLLNEDTPKLKYTSNLSLNFLFGLDTTLFNEPAPIPFSMQNHMENEVDILTITKTCSGSWSSSDVLAFFETFDKQHVYRIKGWLPLLHDNEVRMMIVNYAFKSTQLTPMRHPETLEQFQGTLQLTIMGRELRLLTDAFVKFFGLNPDAHLKLHEAHHH